MADDIQEVRALVRALVQELRDSDPTIAAAGECSSRALNHTQFARAAGRPVCAGESARPNGRDDTPHAHVRAAAESLFDLGVKGGYASAVATRNRKEIGETDGVFEGFAHLVSHGTDEGQGWACAALAQIAFDNTTNCISVVRTPGMLGGLCRVMEHSSKDSKAAAALAVNNISAFSEQASAIIVQV